MANTVSRRSVVYDVTFNLDEGKRSAKEAEKSLEGIDKSATEAEKSVKDLGKQFLQFSGIQGQLNQLKTAMTALSVATGGATGAMRVFKIALAATGIGAIVVALGSLITYLTQTQRGMDIVSKATTAVGVAFAVLVDRVSQFGEGLSFIIRGEFSKGLDALKDSFKGIGDEIARETKESLSLSDALAAVEKEEIKLIQVQAQRRKEISALRIASRDETKTLEERRKSLKQAIDLENAILDDELKIAKERARISQARTDAGESTREELKANAEIQARVIDLETQSNNTKRRLITELNTLTKSTKDYSEALTQLSDQLEKRSPFQQLNDLIDESNAKTAKLKQELEALANIKFDVPEEQKPEDEEAQLKSINAQLQQQVYIREQLNSVIATSGEALGTLAGLAKQGSELQMALAISNILVNQAQAISSAIQGATAAAAATGPGAVVATPAFIATMVGTVIATFAQVFSVINQAKAAQSKATAFAEGEVDIHRPGEVRGKDSIPAVIMPGESVITTDKTRVYKPFLKAIHEGTLEDLIRVNYVEPALAVAALDNAKVDSTLDYSQRFYKQLLATHDGNSLSKRTVRTLERIEKKIGKNKSGWYV